MLAKKGQSLDRSEVVLHPGGEGKRRAACSLLQVAAGSGVKFQGVCLNAE